MTIEQIADMAGVSRGTVDRALNQRGRVNPEVAERIRLIAEETGYVHKKRKRGADKNRKLKLGIVTQLARSSFMMEINRGIKDAEKELSERGIELIMKEGVSVDEEEQIKAIEELEMAGIDGLAVMPVECEQIRLKLNSMIEEKNIPVVTFNSDIVGTKRVCFVGMDNRKSGRTAAGLLGLLMRGTGKVLVITGHFSSHVDNKRVDGFIEEIKNRYPDIEIAGVHGSFDEAEEVERIVTAAMMNISGINGILVVSGGQAGVGRAFERLGLERRPYVVIYDQTPKNKKALETDMVDFLIDQNGYVQGYRPPHILAGLLSRGEIPETEFFYTDINIKTRYNL